MLGFYQRVNDSTVQYAERMLAGKNLPADKTPFDTANHLVNHYKDHGFVIDFDEAMGLLGDKMILQNTIEYRASDEIYKLLDFFRFVLRINDRQFWYVGGIEDGLDTRSIKADNDVEM